MKTAMTLHEVAQHVNQIASISRDLIAPISNLRIETVNHASMLHVQMPDGVRPFELDEIAVLQIADRTDIHRDWFKKIRNEHPALFDHTVNYMFENLRTGKGRSVPRRMLRTLNHPDRAVVRAYLTDSYRPLDNYDLLEAVLPKLNDVEANIESANVLPERMYIKAVSPRIEGEIKRGDVVQAGIVISNSEVGQGSLRVESLLYRLVCTNGMIRATTIRQSHATRGQIFSEETQQFYRDDTKRALDTAFFKQVRDAVDHVLSHDTLNELIRQAQGAAETPIEGNPVEAVEVLATRYNLRDPEKQGVMEHLLRGNDLSQWGMVNAITRASQDVADYQRATDLERLGGQVIELDRNQWREIGGRS